MTNTYYGSHVAEPSVDRSALDAALAIHGYDLDGELQTAVRCQEIGLANGSAMCSFLATVTAQGRLRVEAYRAIDVEIGPYRSAGKQVTRLGVNRIAAAEANHVLETAGKYQRMRAALDRLLAG